LNDAELKCPVQRKSFCVKPLVGASPCEPMTTGVWDYYRLTA
jgi:hypothetical protein